jgi:hypothetical protein
VADQITQDVSLVDADRGDARFDLGAEPTSLRCSISINAGFPIAVL